jgi:hypothetical protein
MTYEPGVRSLCHCWDRRLPLRTTKANLPSHEGRIPIGEPPQTFRDAVSLVRQLGLRHLWIDALRIVQDDEEDWKKEAFCMGHIYQGALFTISAVHAIHTGAGLFTARSFPVTSVARKGSDMHSNHKQLYIRERKDKPWVEDIHGPLDQRAWCLQERLMSRALLHFREEGDGAGMQHTDNFRE